MALPVPQPTFTLALTGASGMPIGLRLLDCLIAAHCRVHLLISPAAYFVAKDECGLTLPSSPQKAQDFFSERYRAAQDQLHVFGHHDWYAPVASGTNVADAMVICPCTMGTLAAIAGGMSDNLIERAADVSIKERKPLILVPRETPLSALHLENMLKLARLGVTILPPMPGFYHQPKSIDDLIDFVVARILDALAVPHQLIPRWGDATTAAHSPEASSQRC